MARPSVVLATNNAKKLAELRRVVGGVDVLALADVASYPEPAETERTFEGNALLKARACVLATGLPALADDSGLEVDVLNGMPGVRSARWAGRHGDDRANLELLLRQVDDVPADERTARFVCAIALVLPDGTSEVHRASWEGHLATAPAGEGGFGYDPVFLPADGQGRTAAQLDAAEKDALSHRGQAVRAMAETMSRLLGTGALDTEQKDGEVR